MEPLKEASPKTDPSSEEAGQPKRRRVAPFWPPAAAVLPPPLPPIAAKHDDLEAIKKAVEDAASVSGPLWLSYLFVMLYLALAAAGVTHADLLLESPIGLPFLNNVNIPLKAFFILAPILFVVLHAYTLAHFVLLSDKAKRFHQELQRQIGPFAENGAEIRKDLRRQLPSNIFVQFLAGPEDLREGWFGLLLTTIAWVTLVGGPVLLLLLLQLQFLPYDSGPITWTARVMLLVDQVLIWWLVGLILSGRSGGHGWWGLKPKAAKAVSALAFSGAFALSWFVFTFPGEWEDIPYRWPPVAWLKAPATAATKLAFGELGGEGDPKGWNWPANSLRLREFNIYTALKIKPDDVKWKPHTFELQHRHLDYADLSLSKLDNVDLRHARLRGARLDEAQLQGASLGDAQLQSASLEWAQLQGASFNDARLQGASLNNAQLQGAWFLHAQLQGASLEDAQLQDALLFDAQLHGASLKGAQLQGAGLLGAQLQGVSLVGAYLWRAELGKLEPDSVAQIRIDQIDWSPAWRDWRKEHRPWNDQSYGHLRKVLEEIPQGLQREAALEIVADLDCKTTRESLASCDPKAKPSPAVNAWRKTLEAARAPNEAAHEQARVRVLSDLVCGGDADSIHILRGLATQWIKKLASKEVSLTEGGRTVKLIERILDDKDHCPVSAALTADDRADLIKIKKGEDAANAEAASWPHTPEKQPAKQPHPSAGLPNRANASRTRSVP